MVGDLEIELVAMTDGKRRAASSESNEVVSKVYSAVVLKGVG